MNIAHIERLYDYNQWANRRLWDCVMRLTDEQFTRPSNYSVGSIQEQVVHMMGAEWLMLSRVLNAQLKQIPAPDEYPTHESIRRKWDEIEAGWCDYLSKLSDSDLGSTVEYTSIVGDTRRSTPLLDILSHCVNHSTDHRAQTLALIHQVGGETIAQDLIFYSWEHPL